MKMGIWYSWLEDVQLIFLYFYLYFSNKLHLDVHLTSQILQTNVWKVKNKLTENLLVKLYPPNLLGDWIQSST